MRRIRENVVQRGVETKGGMMEDLSEAKQIKSKKQKNPKNPGTCRGAAPRGRDT